jgi:hypothetical protein
MIERLDASTGMHTFALLPAVIGQSTLASINATVSGHDAMTRASGPWPVASGQGQWRYWLGAAPIYCSFPAQARDFAFRSRAFVTFVGLGPGPRGCA